MLHRCFTRIAQAIILAMIPLAAPAQQYFDFGSTAFIPRANVPVVVFYAEQNVMEYTVTTTVKDMVFDAQGRYSQQHMAEAFTPKHIDVSTGFFHTSNMISSQGSIGGTYPSGLSTSLAFRRSISVS